MKHIKQKDSWDCVIASVAMFAGVSYDEVLSLYDSNFPSNKKFNGISDAEILIMLRKLGLKPKIVDFVIMGIAGIMYLPSKNDKGGSHAVFFTGNEIFDPNYRVKGKKYYSKALLNPFPVGTLIVVNLKDRSTKEAVTLMKKI